MAESLSDLILRLEAAVEPNSRGRLLDRGIARGLIWSNGILPKGAPQFGDSLSEDLLDYGHAVMAMALRLRARDRNASILERAFLVAGESIESAVHRGKNSAENGFHRITSAVAFHLAKYAARAYSMLPPRAELENLSPSERAILLLLRRRLDDLRRTTSCWLLDPGNGDQAIAERFIKSPEFDESDVFNLVLTGSFMRGLAMFDYSLSSGSHESAAAAYDKLLQTADGALELNAVTHWWTSTMAAQLIDELWQLSFHKLIPELPPTDPDCERWHSIRKGYIQRLLRGKRASIELWPSQLTAANRSLSPSDNLIVALPTSAGKTRIAELCILRALASERRVLYLTPLRALSAQIERDLADTLTPLGFSVSSLYGSAGIFKGDEATLRSSQVVVSTPEKLDFALRNDASLITDIGLIILDEGHMLGPTEREVRYEALVQNLLKRRDAKERRLVCLSALFPTPELMTDLVNWLRSDKPGAPIHSKWKPTRERFGVLSWNEPNRAARLEIKFEQENPFIPRFIEKRFPPFGSKRRSPFPNEKNELTLAAAWKFVQLEKEVLVYCTLRKSVETLGRLALTCIKQGVLPSLRQTNSRIEEAVKTGSEWLSAEHPAVACLTHGIALHHGGLPRPFLTEIEYLLRSGDCPVTIASPTIAQGLNLSAGVLIIPSIWRKGEIIEAKEFANVAGRAGRAFVDLDGLVMHIAWDKPKTAVRNWEALIARTKSSEINSGLLDLTMGLVLQLSDKIGVAVSEIIDYVTGHSHAWSSPPLGENFDQNRWERDLASLDSAILALVDCETATNELGIAIEQALDGSLFTRQLAKTEDKVRDMVLGFFSTRATAIWAMTDSSQRRGYQCAGVGLAAGQFLNSHLNRLVELLMAAETGIRLGRREEAASAIVGFADLVFQTSTFQTPKPLPKNWKEALLAWLVDQPSEVVWTINNDGNDLIQESVTYRLPWAMEALRVHALSVAHPDSFNLTGSAALATEAGSCNLSVVTLLRAGLSSREAAIEAVASTKASFTEQKGMKAWLQSTEIVNKSLNPKWPSEGSSQAWKRFADSEKKGDRQSWKRRKAILAVQWTEQPPAIGKPVVVEIESENGAVFSTDFQLLGILRETIPWAQNSLLRAEVGPALYEITIESFGP